VPMTSLVPWVSLLGIYFLWRYLRDRAKLYRGQQLSAFHEGGCLLFALYLAELAIISFTPVDFSAVGGPLQPVRVNLAPLGTVSGIFASVGPALGTRVWTLVGLLLIYAPVGLLIPLLAPKLAVYRRTLPIGIAISVAIEALQFGETILGMASKQVALDDVLFAIVGTTIGYLIFVVVRSIVRRYNPDFRSEAQLGLAGDDLERELAKLDAEVDEDDAFDGDGDLEDEDFEGAGFGPDTDFDSDIDVEADDAQLDSGEATGLDEAGSESGGPDDAGIADDGPASDKGRAR